MSLGVIALVVAVLGAGGTLWAIFKGVDIAVRKYPRTHLPGGIYKIHKVEDRDDVVELEMIEEEQKDNG